MRFTAPVVASYERYGQSPLIYTREKGMMLISRSPPFACHASTRTYRARRELPSKQYVPVLQYCFGFSSKIYSVA